MAAMTFSDFERSLAGGVPPAGLAPALEALWWAANGEWDRAHRIVMNEAGADAALVHAYLHRVEGDLENAAYWYGRAGRAPATGPLEAEWQATAAELSGTGG